MNCKPGDLAIVVRSKMGNLGKVTRVVRLLQPGDIVQSECGTLVWVVQPDRRAIWLTETAFVLKFGNSLVLEMTAFEDAHLRPLRDNDGVDETLREMELSE